MSGILESIAVIGLAGRFPGAPNLERFWANLTHGVDSISRLSDEELVAAGVPADLLADPSYVKAAPLLPGVDQFDADLFGFTPREAELRDPQQRLFLEATHAAVENAGYDPGRMDGSVGVFGGMATNRYAEYNIRSHRSLADRFGDLAVDMLSVDVANHADYLATTVSYKLGFRGPSLTVATACSTSLVAVHLACNSLRAGECDVALAGGVEVEMPYGWGYRWTPGSIYSPDGSCRPFDVRAQGTVFGSGVGVVALKRLADAAADGDLVRAVIRSSAVNNDGPGRVSFGAPSQVGQTAVIVEALAMANVAPEDISYVEAHGTATTLGDPIEVAALADAHRRLAGAELAPGSCAIGSVKSNLGHLGPAAGVAGLIKTVLALEHEQLPPSINFTEPNPKLELASTPFFVNDRLNPWPRVEARPRRAGISSFGVGGTNAHIVLEEAPAPIPARAPVEPRLVIWSGRDQASERALRGELARHFAEHDEERFAAAATTLQLGRTAHRVRAASVSATAAEAAEALADPDGGNVLESPPDNPGRPVAFLFPGQGAQHRRMAAGHHGVDVTFTAAVDSCLDLLHRQGLDLRAAWLSPDDSSRLDETAMAQPLLFAVEYALAQMWIAWGVQPATLLGHSVGELVAAAVADVLSLEDAVRLVCVRARAMQEMPGGGMLAVAAAEQEVAHLVGNGVALAAVNGPRQMVLSGPLARLDDIAGKLAAEGIASRRLRTSHAFHSPAMAPAVAAFERAFAGVQLRGPRVPLLSAATGHQLTEEQARSPGFWARQLVEPVRFWRGLDTLLREREWLLLEVGPGQALTGVARHHAAVADRRSAAMPTLPRTLGEPADDRRATLAALGRVWAEGHTVDFSAVHRPRPVRRVPIPGYQYQRQRYWVSPPKPAIGALTEPATATPAPVPTVDSDGPFSAVAWVESPQPHVGNRPAGGVALALVPADHGRSLPIVLALQQAGLSVVRVRPAAERGGSDDELRVRPDQPSDLDWALAEVAGRGLEAQVLVHAWTADPWPPAKPDNAQQQLDASFYSMLALVQRGVRPAPGGTGQVPAIVVLTSRSVDVSGSEPLDPIKATLHGVVRTLWEELPGQTCKLVDVGDRAAEVLADELRGDLRSEVVALRGARRWVRQERPLLPVPASAAAVRRKGVYLITGGLGGLGMAVAKGLAQTGLRPSLVVVSRRGLPEGEERERLLAEGDQRLTQLVTAVEELEVLGASVIAIAADVANRRQLRRALDIVTARVGPLNGVVHAAGVPGGGLLALRRPEDAARVLGPKVLGTLLLEDLLAGRPPLDFFVSFSSRAGIDGLLGSGDYAAANAFLDAHAQTTALPDTRVLSLNWPAWSTVGMAVSAPVDTHGWEAELDAQTDWVLDEHRFGEIPVLPGTAYLDLALRALEELPDRPPGAVVLDELVISQPLAAPSPRRVRVSFMGERNGLTVRIMSRPAGNGAGGWVSHATGRVRFTPSEPPTVEVGRLRERLLGAGQPAPEPREDLISFGPRWRCVEEILYGDDETLGVLTLSPAFREDLEAHPLHPALLDVAISIAHDTEGQTRYLPFMYQRVTVFQRLAERVFSHVRRRPGDPDMVVADVDLIGPDGTVLVSIEGFTMRRIDRETFTSGLDAAAATSERADDASRGIPPSEGVRLLLELLSARTPPQVAVRRYADGQYLPLRETPDQPATLAAPARAVPSSPARPSAPEAPAPSEQASVEARLTRLWTASLGLAEVGRDDDFFEIGGDSLSAIQLIASIREQFDVELSIGVLFERSTIGQLAEVLLEQGAG